jgi:uncharacterized protein YggT (Ycf19 family)
VLITVLWTICLVFLIALWVTILFSYVSVMPGSPLESINRVANGIVSPVLNPVRRIMPTARVGGAGLDLSPVVVSVFVVILMYLLG